MAQGPTSHQLEQAMHELLRVREMLLGEDPDIANDDKLFGDMLEGESGSAIEVLDRYILAADHAKTMADAIKQRADQMAARATRYANYHTSLKSGCLNALEALSLRRRDLPELTVSRRVGKGRVVIPDPKNVPAEYRQPPESPPPDISKIGDALDGGEKLGWAYRSNGTPYLAFLRK